MSDLKILIHQRSIFQYLELGYDNLCFSTTDGSLDVNQGSVKQRWIGCFFIATQIIEPETLFLFLTSIYQDRKYVL